MPELNRIEIDRVAQAAHKAAEMLPEFWHSLRYAQIPRVSEEISWAYRPGGTVVDLGGSSGFHASICALLGMKAICVDNYRIRGRGHKDDEYWAENDIAAEAVARQVGVEFIHADLLDWEPPFQDEALDVVMSFDNMEHLHHSPRRLYVKMVRKLKKGGTFILGGPNAANLLKRLRVPLGHNIFSKLSEWYDYDKFIGHVREPVVSDLRYIAADLGLEVQSIEGRNWLGAKHLKRWYGRATDNLLRLRPSLCSDIYLIARK